MALDQWTFAKEFHPRFQAAKTDLEDRLRVAKECSGSSPVTSDVLDNLTIDIAKLAKSLGEATGSLTNHDQRGYELQLKALETALGEIRASAAPKAKFAFKRRVGATPAVNATRPLPPMTSTREPASSGAPNWTITGHSNEYLVMDRTPVAGSDLTISNLSSCILNLTRSTGGDSDDMRGIPMLDISAVHMRNLQNCVLILPSINSSVLAHDLTNCLVAVGCHQFRMHTSHCVDVYIDIASNPVIEKCDRIRFAPYPANILAGHLMAQDGHLHALDFSHIKASPSPNWTGIDEIGRVSVWPIKRMEGECLERALSDLCPVE